MSANAPQPITTIWNIDPVHTTVSRSGIMRITNVKGTLNRSGVITVDEADITRSHKASIECLLRVSSHNVMQMFTTRSCTGVKLFNTIPLPSFEDRSGERTHIALDQNNAATAY